MSQLSKGIIIPQIPLMLSLQLEKLAKNVRLGIRKAVALKQAAAPGSFQIGERIAVRLKRSE